MTIINNSLIDDENKVRLNGPIMYFPDPRKSGALAFAKLFFGIPGRDAELEQNQKVVYALQEDGSAVVLNQPVVCSAGGVPEYLGSQVSIAVAGSYSLKVLGSDDAVEYNIPAIESSNFQGFNGIIAEEGKSVFGSSSLTFDVIEATTASFYMSQSSNDITFKGSYLRKDVDYTIDSSTTITLTQPAANGTVVLGRQMDPTGQIISVSEGASNLIVFNDIASLKLAKLNVDETVTLNGGVAQNDLLGGNKYLIYPEGTKTADGENVIDLDNGNQAIVLVNSFILARYAEKTNDSPSVAAEINIDLSKGNVHKLLLTENVNAVNFLNVNPDTNLTTTVTIKITQDGVTARTVNFSSVNWAGGLTPAMSVALGATDRYVFVTDDAGVSWDGAVMGQDFK